MTDDPESIERLSGPPKDAATARLERFFDSCADELLGTLYYIVGNVEDARDALQESFLKCWHHRHQLDDIQNLKAWVFRITLNTGRDVRKTAWNRRRTPLPENASREDFPMASTSDSPPDGLIKDEQLQQLRKAVAELPPDYQEVFLLRQNGDLSYPQIAEAISIPLGTVKTRMRAAIRQLRESVGDLS
ncbi:RNA polymerase sigma factor [Roseiconus lacunae]|uniref:RNA polymerase sigma factor n=1 Tax=Roseiconus lacunae TaxID=2605694 RepID=UPI0011F2791D|nr:sigma-70 family RNA polymerase sigma factor [Roseiconus lacunae]MCD0459294.1 sigma-70 family RNA polymerase sigma factor [Roseiconus lacunae]WRQ53137.1 sigma-70 family RNA polymerase sigma factor [Stieleria sp. HD01]